MGKKPESKKFSFLKIITEVIKKTFNTRLKEYQEKEKLHKIATKLSQQIYNLILRLKRLGITKKDKNY